MKYFKYQEPNSKLQNPRFEDKYILGFGIFILELEIL